MTKKFNDITYAEKATARGVSPLESYLGSSTKIKHMCHTCKNIWTTQPRQVINGVQCRHCYKISVSKPIEKVKESLLPGRWEIVNDLEYHNSYLPLHFRHYCGHVVKSSLEVILRTDNHRKRCTICEPIKVKRHWSSPVSINSRKYSSGIEATCCEYLIDRFGNEDIVLQKEYIPGDRRTADAYIKSLDTYVEVSTIKKPWYLERIYRKRALVRNFIFVSSLQQLRIFFE